MDIKLSTDDISHIMNYIKDKLNQHGGTYIITQNNLHDLSDEQKLAVEKLRIRFGNNYIDQLNQMMEEYIDFKKVGGKGGKGSMGSKSHIGSKSLKKFSPKSYQTPAFKSKLISSLQRNRNPATKTSAQSATKTPVQSVTKTATQSPAKTTPMQTHTTTKTSPTTSKPLPVPVKAASGKTQSLALQKHVSNVAQAADIAQSLTPGTNLSTQTAVVEPITQSPLAESQKQIVVAKTTSHVAPAKTITNPTQALVSIAKKTTHTPTTSSPITPVTATTESLTQALVPHQRIVKKTPISSITSKAITNAQVQSSVSDIKKTEPHTTPSKQIALTKTTSISSIPLSASISSPTTPITQKESSLKIISPLKFNQNWQNQGLPPSGHLAIAKIGHQLSNIANISSQSTAPFTTGFFDKLTSSYWRSPKPAIVPIQPTHQKREPLTNSDVQQPLEATVISKTIPSKPVQEQVNEPIRASEELLQKEDKPVKEITKTPVREPITEPITETITEQIKQSIPEATKEITKPPVKEPIKNPENEQSKDLTKELQKTQETLSLIQNKQSPTLTQTSMGPVAITIPIELVQREINKLLNKKASDKLEIMEYRHLQELQDLVKQISETKHLQEFQNLTNQISEKFDDLRITTSLSGNQKGGSYDQTTSELLKITSTLCANITMNGGKYQQNNPNINNSSIFIPKYMANNEISSDNELPEALSGGKKKVLIANSLYTIDE